MYFDPKINKRRRLRNISRWIEDASFDFGALLFGAFTFLMLAGIAYFIVIKEDTTTCCRYELHNTVQTVVGSKGGVAVVPTVTKTCVIQAARPELCEGI